MDEPTLADMLDLSWWTVSRMTVAFLFAFIAAFVLKAAMSD